MSKTLTRRADRDHEPFFTVPHVDDDFGVIAEVCPDIDVLLLQPVTG